jgi:Abortive infection C-terminus
MRLGEGAIANLAGIAYDTGMNSTRLIGFFNSFGLDEPVVRMLDNKTSFAEQAWRKLNGTDHIAEAINQILSPHFYPGEGDRENRVEALRRCVARDGFDLIDDGNRLDLVPKSGAAATNVLQHLRVHGEKISHENVLSRIRIIERTCETSPADAIGSAKELIEAVCKDIIERSGEAFDKAANPSALVRQALKCLHLAPDDIPERSRGVDAIKATLNGLGNIAHQMDELRALYGSGHGKPSSARGLTPRHARLSVGAAGTLCLFLIETYEAGGRQQ